MICLHYLLVLIHIFLHVYFCVTFDCVLLADYPHKSYPDLGLNPSRVLVKFSRAYPWFSISIPFSPFGGLKGPEGSGNIPVRNIC